MNAFHQIRVLDKLVTPEGIAIRNMLRGEESSARTYSAVEIKGVVASEKAIELIHGRFNPFHMRSRAVLGEGKSVHSIITFSIEDHGMFTLEINYPHNGTKGSMTLKSNEFPVGEDDPKIRLAPMHVVLEATARLLLDQMDAQRRGAYAHDSASEALFDMHRRNNTQQ